MQTNRTAIIISISVMAISIADMYFVIHRGIADSLEALLYIRKTLLQKMFNVDTAMEVLELRRQENGTVLMYESIQKREQRTVFRSLLQVANIIRITAKTTTFDRHIGVAGNVKSSTKVGRAIISAR